MRRKSTRRHNHSLCLSIGPIILVFVYITIYPLSVYLFMIYLFRVPTYYLSVYLSIHLSIYPSIYLSIYLFVCLSVRLSVSLSLSLSLSRSISLLVFLSIWELVYPLLRGFYFLSTNRSRIYLYKIYISDTWEVETLRILRAQGLLKYII